jgi:hypothetical protein
MKLSLPPKLLEKLVWVPITSFCKIFILSYTFDAILYQTDLSRPHDVGDFTCNNSISITFGFWF